MALVITLIIDLLLVRMIMTRCLLLLALFGSLFASAQERSIPLIALSKNDSAHVFPSHDRSSLGADHLPPIDLLRMPSPYSYQHLGIFCKAEVKMNKWFPLPVMFRLGDVERAEELDGKGAYRSLR